MSEDLPFVILIGIIADIRQKSGVGAKPMLGELADAIEARIAAAEREGMRRAVQYHLDLAAQHEAALVDSDIEGNAWHLAQSVVHRRHANAILSQAGEA